MVIEFWIFVLLIATSSIWGILHCRRQGRELRELKQSLEAAHQKVRDQEITYNQNKTRWEETEEKLRGYLKLLDTVINTIPNPVYFKDATGIYRGCNQVFANRILGLTRDRIIGKRIQELPDQIPDDLAVRYAREERILFQKRYFHSFEAKVRCADGQRRDYLFSLAPVMDGQGAPSGSVGVLSDLTDKNRAARNRFQKDDQTSINTHK